MFSHLDENQTEDSCFNSTGQCLGIFNDDPETSENQQGQVVDDDDQRNSQRSGSRSHKVYSYEFLEFPYASLETATGNFTDRIGIGYYGSVYKGTLSGLNKKVAVKVLVPEIAGCSSEDLASMAHEISRARHPNVAKFVGYCNELDKRILVYEFVQTNMNFYIHDLKPPMLPLDWPTRMKIVHGVAKGVDYLLNTMTPMVIYGDLTSSDILLDEGFNPKISGLGPGQFRRGGPKAEAWVSREHDIHCFGLLFLELLTGRKAYDVDRSDPLLSFWVQSRLLSGESKEIPDPMLMGKVRSSMFEKACKLAMFCTHEGFAKQVNFKDVICEIEYFTGQKVDTRPRTPFDMDGFETKLAQAAAEQESGKEEDGGKEERGEEEDDDNKEDE